LENDLRIVPVTNFCIFAKKNWPNIASAEGEFAKFSTNFYILENTFFGVNVDI
jgi:hypothetical protein